MKKHWKNCTMILIVALVVMIPLFCNPYYVGHDTKFHVANVLSIQEQILKGQLFNPILGNIANGFGYGTRLFYPGLAHTTTAILSVILNPITTNITISFKLIHLFTVFFAGLTMYFCAYKFSKAEKCALFSSILYMTMPYFLSNIYRRCALAESFVFIFIPLIFSAIFSLLEHNQKKFYPLFIIGYTGAFLSHFTVMIYFTIFLAIFLLLYRKQTFKKEFLRPFFFATVCVILLILPFLETMMFHKFFGNYVVFEKGTMYHRIASTALTPIDYLNPFPILEYNDTKYHFLMIVSILLFLAFLYYKKIEFPKYSKGIVVFGFLAFFLSSFLFPWEIMPSFLKMIQFPWRLVTFLSFSVCLIVPLCLQLFSFKLRFIYPVLLLVVVVSGYFSITFASDVLLDQNDIWWNGGMGWQREYLPVSCRNDLDYYTARGKDVLIKNGGYADIVFSFDDLPNYTFQIKNVLEDTVVEFPRIFYYGYVLGNEKGKIPLYENEQGFLEAKIQEDGMYQLTYEGTTSQKIARFISCGTLCFLLSLWILKKVFIKN